MKQSFRDLQVWHKAIRLTEFVYLMRNEFPKHEFICVTSPMSRAAVSIAGNIAEGLARASRKHFRHLVFMAKGSTCEPRTQLVIAARLSYIFEANTLRYEQLADRVARMLSGVARALKQPAPSTT